MSLKVFIIGPGGAASTFLAVAKKQSFYRTDTWKEARLSFLAASVSRMTGLTGIAGFCPVPPA